MTVYGFNDRAIAEGIKRNYLNRTVNGTRPQTLPDLPRANCRTWIAKTSTGGISARSGGTPGTGYVDLQRRDANGDFSTMKARAPVKSFNTVAMTSGSYCTVGNVLGLPGKWLLDVPSFQYVAKATASITARSTAGVAGSGTVDLYHNTTGGLASFSTGVTVKNWVGEALSSGDWLWCGTDSAGVLWVLNKDCSST